METNPIDTRELLRKLALQLERTKEREISCDECYDLLDEYVEIVMRGDDVRLLMPAVQAHLELCQDCGEEFAAILKALESRS